jgi:hypothetical protein
MAEERRGKSVLELPISNVGTEERKISAEPPISINR